MKVKIFQNHKVYCPECKKLNCDEDNISGYDEVTCEYCCADLDVCQEENKENIKKSDFAGLKALSESNKITFSKNKPLRIKKNRIVF